MFTVHPGDYIRERLPENASVLIVAAAHWRGNGFRVLSLPFAEYAIDSGGFTAAARWGKYPWSPEQYVEFVYAMTEKNGKPVWVAVMDYACEREVNREALITNRQRIQAGLDNETKLRALAPDIAWLPVLQGNTLEERAWELMQREERGLLPCELAGIGTVCRRSPVEAAEVVKFYRQQLPEVKFHGFGFAVRAVDVDAVALALASWDSYGWAFGRGKTQLDLHGLERRPGETSTQQSRRMSEHYLKRVIEPRLRKARQFSFM